MPEKQQSQKGCLPWWTYIKKISAFTLFRFKASRLVLNAIHTRFPCFTRINKTAMYYLTIIRDTSSPWSTDESSPHGFAPAAFSQPSPSSAFTSLFYLLQIWQTFLLYFSSVSYCLCWTFVLLLFCLLVFTTLHYFAFDDACAIL